MVDDLFSMVQKLGIFIILSQTLLHFRPNEEYEKYIKILCNIIILSMFIVPVLGLFQKDISNEFEVQVKAYQKKMEQIEAPVEKQLESTGKEMNDRIREEIKSRLNKMEIKNYKITNVMLNGMDQSGSYDTDNLQITVVLKADDNAQGTIKVDKINLGKETEVIETDSNMKGYREEFARILGISEDYVEVVVRG